jgi:hypothetical protein
MSLFYRLLGMVAALGKGLSQLRLTLHFVFPIAPCHWLLMIGLVVATYFFVLSARDGFINESSPTALPFKQVLERKDLTNRYVSISGMLAPEGSQTFVKKRRGGDETVDAVYVPFGTEDESSPILFVKYKQAPSNKTAHTATVTGMLRAPNSRLQEKAREIKDRFAPATIDLTNVLDAEDRPPRPWPFVALSSACGLLCAMMLYTRFMKWTVYRRVDSFALAFASATSAVGESPELDLRVTGPFKQHGGSMQYVHDAPAHLVVTPAGELAFATTVVTDEAVLRCSIVMKPDGLKSWDEGLLYCGFTAHPAVRQRFIDGNTGREAVAFVKLADEAQRRAFLQVVTTTPGYKLV